MTLRLFWDRAGAGEPLLLLHGIGSTHDDFVALRPRLDAEYRVLAPDLPGHGRSPALPERPTIAAMGCRSVLPDPTGQRCQRDRSLITP